MGASYEYSAVWISRRKLDGFSDKFFVDLPAIALTSIFRIGNPSIVDRIIPWVKLGWFVR
jgi:hypothetical protein